MSYPGLKLRESYPSAEMCILYPQPTKLDLFDYHLDDDNYDDYNDADSVCLKRF